jgi:hypothetical protein
MTLSQYPQTLVDLDDHLLSRGGVSTCNKMLSPSADIIRIYIASIESNANRARSG